MKTPLPILFLAFELLAGISRVAAQGTEFMYQGRLNDGGSPASGNYDFTFALFDNSGTNRGQIGDTLAKPDVGVTNGFFSVTLDFGGVFAGTSSWLAIAVRTNGSAAYEPLSPLQALAPTPYAIFAPNAGVAARANSILATHITGAIPLSQLPVSVVTNRETGVTLSGRFSGDGSGLTGLNANNLASGTVPLAQISGITSNQLSAATWKLATNLNGGNAALASNVVSGIKITNAIITNSVFAGNGGALTNIRAAALVGAISQASLPTVVITNKEAAEGVLPLAALSQTGATTGQYLEWNGQDWVPGNVSARVAPFSLNPSQFTGGAITTNISAGVVLTNPVIYGVITGQGGLINAGALTNTGPAYAGSFTALGNNIGIPDITISTNPFGKSAFAIVSGDSLTLGYLGVTNYFTCMSNHYGMCFPNSVNTAIAGQTAGFIYSNYTALIGNYTTLRPGTNSGVLFEWSGINDLWRGFAAEQVFGFLTNIWAEAHSAGFKVVAFTITQQGFNGAASAYDSVQFQRFRLNAMIRNSPLLWDYLVDVAAFTPSPANTAYWYIDSDVHFTSAAQDFIAYNVSNVLVRPPHLQTTRYEDPNSSLFNEMTAETILTNGDVNVQGNLNVAGAIIGNGGGLKGVSLSSLAQSGAAPGQYAQWNGTNWAPASLNGGHGEGAVIQRLNEKLEETRLAAKASDGQIEALKQENDALAERLNELEAMVRRLAARQ